MEGKAFNRALVYGLHTALAYRHTYFIAREFSISDRGAGLKPIWDDIHVAQICR